LTREIEQFHQWMQPTSEELVVRHHLINKLQRIVRDASPTCQLELFGSTRNGLGVAISDIDMRLLPAAGDMDSSSIPESIPLHSKRQEIIKKLRSIESKLKADGEFFLVFLRHARYPLVSMQHKESGLEVQIVSNYDSQLSRQYIQKYMDMYPGIGEVFTVMRTILDIRGLNDVFRGGLGSYSMFMLIAAVYRTGQVSASSSLGHQFLGVLKYWSEFDTYNYGACLEPPEIFVKGAKKPIIVAQKEKERQKACIL
jgi:non-canonical poly(A) RNA polymerase PAPD5/7